MTSIFQNMERILPQGPPMIMVDELVSSEAESSISSFIIQKDNVLLHNGKVTEALLLENIAQTAAAHSGYKSYHLQSQASIGYIVSIKNAWFGKLPEVGQKLITTIKIINQVFDFTIIEGSTHCEGERVCSCEMRIYIKKQEF